jgi:hypothetical protein
VIINVFEFLLKGVILANDMQAAIAALGKQMGGGALASFTVWGFLVGIFAVWLYAAIRPRFGAGRATALCAAEPVWCLGYLVAAVTPFALNLSRTSLGDRSGGRLGGSQSRHACGSVDLSRADALSRSTCA